MQFDLSLCLLYVSVFFSDTNTGPWLASVVNILSHLTSTHLTHVQTALHSLLVSSVVSSPREASVALAGVVSSGVRRAATTRLASLLFPIIDQLPSLYQHWIPAHWPSNDGLLVTITQLLMVTDRGGSQLMLKTGAGAGELARAASIILNTILAELFTKIHSGYRPEVPSH